MQLLSKRTLRSRNISYNPGKAERSGYKCIVRPGKKKITSRDAQFPKFPPKGLVEMRGKSNSEDDGYVEQNLTDILIDNKGAELGPLSSFSFFIFNSNSFHSNFYNRGVDRKVTFRI